jgi:hypothetical protein
VRFWEGEHFRSSFVSAAYLEARGTGTFDRRPRGGNFFIKDSRLIIQATFPK